MKTPNSNAEIVQALSAEKGIANLSVTARLEVQ